MELVSRVAVFSEYQPGTTNSTRLTRFFFFCHDKFQQQICYGSLSGAQYSTSMREENGFSKKKSDFDLRSINRKPYTDVSKSQRLVPAFLNMKANRQQATLDVVALLMLGFFFPLGYIAILSPSADPLGEAM